MKAGEFRKVLANYNLHLQKKIYKFIQIKNKAKRLIFVLLISKEEDSY